MLLNILFSELDLNIFKACLLGLSPLCKYIFKFKTQASF